MGGFTNMATALRAFAQPRRALAAIGL